MTSADGRFTLVYNGEIYNYRELRRSLSASGFSPASSGDTQVLLHGLMRWGAGFVERLNGMFAFAFWDDRERELLLVRDPVGIKPCLLRRAAGWIARFCQQRSRRRCVIRTFGGVSRHFQTDPTAPYVLSFTCSERTTQLKGISPTAPGTLLRWRFEGAEYRAAHLLASTLQAVQRHVRKIRPTWTAYGRRLRTPRVVSSYPTFQLVHFLSGGLDSSLITAIAAAAGGRDNPFRSYTITYPPQSNRLDQAPR